MHLFGISLLLEIYWICIVFVVLWNIEVGNGNELNGTTAGVQCGKSAYFLPVEHSQPQPQPHPRQPHFKITNGDMVPSDSKYPWMAALFRNDGKCPCRVVQNLCYCCSASIVGPNYLLLAAHCFVENKQEQKMLTAEEALEKSQFRLGSADYTSPNVSIPRVKRIIIHENFDIVQMLNDIALVELAEPLVFSENIWPICLSKQFNETAKLTMMMASGDGGNVNKSDSNSNDGTPPSPLVLEASIAGWGHQHESVFDDNGQVVKDAQKPDENPQLLREGQAKLISEEECKRENGRKYAQYICDQHICMGIGHQNGEKGDSGGPLFLNINNDNNNDNQLLIDNANGMASEPVFAQIGVTSFSASHTRSEKRRPVVYTRISAFCNWIEEKTSGDVKCI